MQTRSVSCIQELRHGLENTIRVGEILCPQPPPIREQFCNVVDCKPEWKVAPWTDVRKILLMCTHVHKITIIAL